jgi:hypothetical protein
MAAGLLARPRACSLILTTLACASQRPRRTVHVCGCDLHNVVEIPTWQAKRAKPLAVHAWCVTRETRQLAWVMAHTGVFICFTCLHTPFSTDTNLTRLELECLPLSLLSGLSVGYINVDRACHGYCKHPFFVAHPQASNLNAANGVVALIAG